MKTEREQNDQMTDFFRTAFEKEEIPFDDAAWKEAEQLLNADHRKRRGIIFWIASGAIGTALLLSALWFSPFNVKTYGPRQDNAHIDAGPLHEAQNKNVGTDNFSETRIENGPSRPNAPSTVGPPKKMKGANTSSGNSFAEGDQALTNSETAPVSANPQHASTGELTAFASPSPILMPVPDSLQQKAPADEPLHFKPVNLSYPVMSMPYLGLMPFDKPTGDVLEQGRAVPVPKNSRFRQGLVAGLSARFSEDKLHTTPDVFGGVWFSYMVSGRMEAGAQFDYHLTNGHGIVHESGSTEYGFNRTHTVSTVYTRQLHYLEAPLHLGMHFGRTQLLCGAKPAFLINTTDRLMTEVNGNANSTARNTYGYMDGLHRFDISPFIGVQRVVHEHYIVGTRFEYGLLDVTKDSHYGSGDHRLLHLKIYLQFIQ